jgi:hypothetical protein
MACLRQLTILRKRSGMVRRSAALLLQLYKFSMRNFTNASVVDDRLPVGDGQLKIGAHVPVHQLRDAMEDCRRKGYLPKNRRWW